MVLLDHSEDIESLRNRVPAVQNAVVVNFDSRPYRYDAWTEVDGNLLRYPEQADHRRSTFQGTVGFSRAPTGARGRDHYDKIVYEDDDANHMFGINGANVVRECVRLVLVPAATNISSDVGSACKGSTLNELIGALMAEAGARAQAEWFIENEAAIQNLKQKIAASVEGSTRTQAGRVNDRLNALIPNAKIDLTPKVPDWTPKSEAVVSTDVTIDVASRSKKDLYAYRSAIFDADMEDLPDVLRNAAHTLANFK